jgi:hypothetical protein
VCNPRMFQQYNHSPTPLVSRRQSPFQLQVACPRTNRQLNRVSSRQARHPERPVVTLRDFPPQLRVDSQAAVPLVCLPDGLLVDRHHSL